MQPNLQPPRFILHSSISVNTHVNIETFSGQPLRGLIVKEEKDSEDQLTKDLESVLLNNIKEKLDY